MGYILFIGIGLIVLVLLLAGFMRGSAAGGPRGTLPSDHDPSRTDPAADEPTPGRSVTASKSVAENARQHTPPA